MRATYHVVRALALCSLVMIPLGGFGQTAAQGSAPGISKLCMIPFDKDTQRPARLQDGARECITRAVQQLKTDPRMQLYLVAAADRIKDNHAGNGTSRTEQDMTGEDLRYADVAAYRAINTKAYMVRWSHVDAKRIVPVTSYEDGQWLEIYSAPRGSDFRSLYGRKIAPIIERPCTTGPCAGRYEEFLVAQQRARIPE